MRKAHGDRGRNLRLHQRQSRDRDDRPARDRSIVPEHTLGHLTMTDFSPREIVSELDRHIIGQQDAKRAVAIALRNRWRRLQLTGAMRDEVLPKNILMIGPTGCGKTEISRRLAKLANAPFLKVEATKFTEVGYVGRDVEQIIRDLLEIGIGLVKEAEAQGHRGRSRKPPRGWPCNASSRNSSIVRVDTPARPSGRMAIETRRAWRTSSTAKLATRTAGTRCRSRSVQRTPMIVFSS